MENFNTIRKAILYRNKFGRILTMEQAKNLTIFTDTEINGVRENTHDYYNKTYNLPEYINSAGKQRMVSVNIVDFQCIDPSLINYGQKVCVIGDNITPDCVYIWQNKWVSVPQNN